MGAWRGAASSARHLGAAQAYLAKARLRTEVLDLLLSRGGFSDVVREAQELVERVCKGMRPHVGIEPPK